MEDKLIDEQIENYPSSVFINVIYDEYSRECNEYNNMYNKTYPILAICCTTIITLCGFIYQIYRSVKIEVLLLLISFASLVILFFSVSILLGVCKGSKLKVLKLETFRDEWFKHTTTENAKRWLTDVLLKRIADMREISNKKQSRIDLAINCIYLGFAVFFVGFILYIF